MSKKKKSKRSSTSLPIIILSVGLLLVIVAAVMFVESNKQTQQNNASVGRISASEAKTAADSGQAIILDVRSETSFAVSHAAGAISIPLEELSQRLDELDPNQWIITYCT